MCHEDIVWTAALPIIFLGLRTSYKEDVHSSAAELLYGETLRIPGEMLGPTTAKVEPSTFLLHLKRHMERLRPTSAARHLSSTKFVHKDLKDTTHVFLHQDAVRRALEPAYNRPYKVMSRSHKTYDVSINGRTIKISIDRLKPAYLDEATSTDDTQRPVHFPPRQAPSVILNPPTHTFRYGRTARAPVHFAP